MLGVFALIASAGAADVVDVRLDGSVMLVTPAAYLNQVEVVGDPVVEVLPTGRPGVVHLVGIQSGEATLRLTRDSGSAQPFTYDVRVSDGGGPRRVRLDVPVGTFIAFQTPRPVDYMATSNGSIAQIQNWGVDPNGRPSQLITSTGPGRTDLVLLLEGVDEPLYYEVVSRESSTHEVVELTGRGWVPLGLPDDVDRPAVSDRSVVQIKRRKGAWAVRARSAGVASVASWLPSSSDAWIRHFNVVAQ